MWRGGGVCVHFFSLFAGFSGTIADSFIERINEIFVLGSIHVFRVEISPFV
jgi:hypothetical protein